MKSALIELQDSKNRTMRSNLIFKDINESANGKWENTVQVLPDFIHENINLGYSFKEIDSQTTRAHRSSDNNNGKNKIEKVQNQS